MLIRDICRQCRAGNVWAANGLTQSARLQNIRAHSNGQKNGRGALHKVCKPSACKLGAWEGEKGA
jgi:hypothetical protein